MELMTLYPQIFAVATWITDEIYDLEYDELEQAFDDVLDIDVPEFEKYITRHAPEISKRIELRFEHYRKYKCEHCGVQIDEGMYCSKSCQRYAKDEYMFDEMRENY